MAADEATARKAPGGITTLEEWRRGWPVVVASFVGCAIAGMHLYAIGPLIRPLAAQYHWPRAQISIGVTLTTIGGVFAAPVVGAVVDRVGARRIALAGVCFYAAGLAVVGLSGPSIWSWYGAWGLVALTYFAVSSLVWALGIASRFTRSRGLALAAGNCGIALASTLVPILTVLIARNFGWRMVYFSLGGFAILVGLTTTWVFFFDAGDLARGKKIRSEEGGAGPAAREGVDFTQALRSGTFWRLAVSLLIFSYCSSTIVVHAQAILADHGVKPATAALYAALSGPSLVLGRLGAGVLLDLIHTRYVAAALFAAEAAAVVLLLLVQNTPWRLAPLFICAGLAGGAEYDMLSYAASRYFGLRRYGSILGLLLGFVGLGYGVGPVAAGLFYDLQGSYRYDLMGMALALGLGALLTGTLGRYPDGPSDGLRTASPKPKLAVAEPGPQRAPL
ncbi:MAG: MFS transporter [Caulobacteraceae bacterium]|nr:MFS transporter [Caulobacteraceae bacterium]